MNVQNFQRLAVAYNAGSSRESTSMFQVNDQISKTRDQAKKAVKRKEEFILGVIAMLDLKHFELLWQMASFAKLAKESICAGAMVEAQKLELLKVDDLAPRIGTVPQVDPM